MTVVALFIKISRSEHDLSERKLFMLSSGNDSVGGVTKLIRSVTCYTLSFELIGALILANSFHTAIRIQSRLVERRISFCFSFL